MIADFIIIDKEKTIYRLNIKIHDEFLHNILSVAKGVSFLRKNKNNTQLLSYIKDFLNNDSNNYLLMDQQRNTLIVPNNTYIMHMIYELPKLECKNYNQVDKSVRLFLKGVLEI